MTVSIVIPKGSHNVVLDGHVDYKLRIDGMAIHPPNARNLRMRGGQMLSIAANPDENITVKFEHIDLEDQ